MVAESAGGAFDLFDESVDPFGSGVGDAAGDERCYHRPPDLHGGGEGIQLVDPHPDTPRPFDVGAWVGRDGSVRTRHR